MILGIGTDIIEIARVARARDNFINRIYTPAETATLSPNPGRRAEQLAGMFAGKEAVVKALGCGFGSVTPCEVEILRADGNPPRVRLTGAAKTLADTLGADEIYLSISHCKEYATAYAVITSRQEPPSTHGRTP